MGSLEKQLYSLAEESYAKFTRSLIPSENTYPIIGVRKPLIRKLAKDIVKSDKTEAISFLKRKHKTHESNLLHGMLIDILWRNDYDKTIIEIEKFLPSITNWEVCDCLSPKVFLTKKEKLKPLVNKWLESNEVYTVRFGIVCTMRLYLNEDSFDKDLMWKIAHIRSNEYYIRMGIAWYMSYALIFQYHDAKDIIASGEMEIWTRNKSIQKAKESFRISNERKEELDHLKV